jgi:hypothetical protein
MPDYAKHYQHIQRLVSLTIAPELPDAIAAVVLLDHLSALAAETTLPATAVAALDPVSVPVFRPRDIIAMALQAEEPPSLGRLHALLDRRFEEHRERRAGEDPGSRVRAVRDAMPAADPAHADVWAELGRHLAAIRDRLTARLQEASPLADQASQAFDSSHRDAETQLANYRRAAARPKAEAAWWKILRAGGVWWIVPALIAALLYLIGQPALRAAFAGAVAATAVALWARRLGEASANPATALARVTPRLCAPAADALATWFELREETAVAAAGLERLAAINNLLRPELEAGTAITANLASIRQILVRHLDQVSEGPLEEPRPGLVRVTGAEVARALAAGANLSSPDLSLVPSRELPAAELAPTAQALLAHIRSQLPEVALPAALAAVESLAGGRLLLEQYLRMLVASATSAARLKPGTRLDRSLCPEMLSIGLPEGASSSLVPLVARLFPQAPIMAAFRPGRLEILYDIANASRDQLRITEMAEDAYVQATALERQLWHLPRRYRGLHGEPQPDLRAV